MNKQYKITLHNNIKELTRLAQEIERVSIINNFNDALKFNINLSLDEIVTNIISYGYKDDFSHIIEINFSFSDNYLCIEIIDDGIEFNPLTKSQPNLELPLEDREIGGLGIHLVRSLMDKVEYERKNDKNYLKLYKSFT